MLLLAVDSGGGGQLDVAHDGIWHAQPWLSMVALCAGC